MRFRAKTRPSLGIILKDIEDVRFGRRCGDI
jgi:hypothetical protein